MGSRGTVNMETEKAITGVVAFFVTSVCKKRQRHVVCIGRKEVIELKRRLLPAAGTVIEKAENALLWITGLGYTAWIALVCSCSTAYASDIFTVAKTAMQKVYNDVAGLATVGAVVCAAVCLFLMNFSKSGKTVDESRAWLKRIIICWAALMTLGAIVTYMKVLIPQSTFTA